MRCIVPAFAAFGVPAPGRLFLFITPPGGYRAVASVLRRPASMQQGLINSQAPCVRTGRCAPAPFCKAAGRGKQEHLIQQQPVIWFPCGEIQRLPLAFTSLSCVEHISAMTVKICSLSAAGSSVRSLRLRLPSLIPSAAASSHSLNPFVATAFRISALARFIKSPSNKD